MGTGSEEEEPSLFTVKWAINYLTARQCVDLRQMFILTKSRFKLVQNNVGPAVRGRNVTTMFCQFLGDEHLSKIYKEEKAQPVDVPTMQKFELAVFNCPFRNCSHVSEKKFTGIRTHLLHHFKDEI